MSANPHDPSTRVRALLDRLRPVVEKAPKGPWRPFISEQTRTIAVMRGIAEEIIGWSGFDSSALPLAEQVRLAEHIAALDRETGLQLLDLLAAAVTLTDGCITRLGHEQQGEACRLCTAFNNEGPVRHATGCPIAAWTAAAGRVEP